MSTIVHVTRTIVTTLVAGALALLAGTPGAWAITLPDGPDTGVPFLPPAGHPATSGVEVWQVISIAATCALVAVLVTLLVLRLVRAHHMGARSRAHA